MPDRPLRPCPGCSQLVREPGRCSACRRKKWKRQNQARDPETIAFYNSKAWRDFRAWFLADHPICQCEKRCRRASTEVHHIIPRRERPDLALDPMKCKALSKPCHSRETAREVWGG